MTFNDDIPNVLFLSLLSFFFSLCVWPIHECNVANRKRVPSADGSFSRSRIANGINLTWCAWSRTVIWWGSQTDLPWRDCNQNYPSKWKVTIRSAGSSGQLSTKLFFFLFQSKAVHKTTQKNHKHWILCFQTLATNCCRFPYSKLLLSRS